MDRLTTALANPDPMLGESVSYFLSKKGKFVRPLLTLLSCEVAGGRFEDALDYACAVELIHSSSLIFDDLPCMDDATTRRGQTCLHKRWGDALAILAGVYFLTKAFQLAAGSDRHGRRAVILLAKAIADNGMVQGQILDISGAHDLDEVRNLKTTPLVLAAVQLGAYAAGANGHQERALHEYGKGLGLAFQLRDDVLDGETNTDSQSRAEMIAADARRQILSVFGTSDSALTLASLALYAAKRPE